MCVRRDYELGTSQTRAASHTILATRAHIGRAQGTMLHAARAPHETAARLWHTSFINSMSLKLLPALTGRLFANEGA